MNKKLLSSLLLVGVLAGCGSTSNSSSTDDFFVPESSSTTQTNDSSSTSTEDGTPDPVIPDNGSLTVPETKYSLLITMLDSTRYYVPLVDTDPWYEGDSKFDQCMADDVQLTEGDTFVFFDKDGNEGKGAEWVINIQSAGQSNSFRQESDKIVVLNTGTYDFYVKLQYNNDMVYIGNQDGQ